MLIEFFFEGSYRSRKGLQEKKNQLFSKKPNFKNGGASPSAWASPFFSSKTDSFIVLLIYKIITPYWAG